MSTRLFGLGIGYGAIALHALAPFSFAWEQHQLLQETALAAMRGRLERISLSVPSTEQDTKVRKTLLQELGLNNKIPVTRWAHNAWDLLVQLPTVDEPDQGMDQDLPANADPKNDRAWMGGSQGSYSQGFRHMLFLGWAFRDPLASFQIPPRRLGLADQRAALLFERALELQEQGQFAWAWRTLGWALHFVQDLSQPFHSTQVPHPALVPWGVLSPSRDGIRKFISATTSQLGSVHTHFEKQIQHLWISGAIQEICATEFRRDTSTRWSSASDVRTIALHAAQLSHGLAWNLGEAIAHEDELLMNRTTCLALQIGLGATERTVEIFLNQSRL